MAMKACNADLKATIAVDVFFQGLFGASEKYYTNLVGASVSQSCLLADPACLGEIWLLEVGGPSDVESC